MTRGRQYLIALILYSAAWFAHGKGLPRRVPPAQERLRRDTGDEYV